MPPAHGPSPTPAGCTNTSAKAEIYAKTAARCLTESGRGRRATTRRRSPPAQRQRRRECGRGTHEDVGRSGVGFDLKQVAHPTHLHLRDLRVGRLNLFRDAVYGLTEHVQMPQHRVPRPEVGNSAVRSAGPRPPPWEEHIFAPVP